ncbi:hypothetical protein V7S43_015980 [Phytophthora oleae]|uniref:FYVE-type domain-containing protein n=1 Tax=Phytophthora oleae TaxID=2107226 RepID=A0ABD3F0G9_9STRA
MWSSQESPPIRRLRTWGRSQPIALSMDVVENNAASSESSVTASDANFSRFSMSQLTIEPRSSPDTLLSDLELLRRARNVHASTDFGAIAAGIEEGGAWQVIETVDRFSIFRRHGVTRSKRRTVQREARTEVLCVGRLDASLDEVIRILCPDSEAEHNATMRGLYDKNFIFGTIDRSNRYWKSECDAVDGEQLSLKTSSFVHTKPFGHNEQWCYLDFFQRNAERDGFTISQRCLRPDKSTPGRVAGGHARVHQLHRLAASYLVVQLPDRRGLHVVFHCWFDPVGSNLSCHGRPRSLSDSTTIPLRVNSRREAKAQDRRLLALARGVAQLPAYMRRRRFSLERLSVPVENTRCPCCTCSLSTVKLTLATGLSDWKRLKKKRCYLCGYLVCGVCWSTAQMETDTGRVASIVACTRCNISIKSNRPERECISSEERLQS